ncbi:hypothetical protein CL633_02155 [bacterium]|nr:hypothetical protein [bacterium]|tara:strand:+ start:5288 stop:6859 length:1572 start_codon:yes stop_codon:yes gene_type:complete
MLDILIQNANIIDGTGKKKFQADLGIKNGKIKKIGKIKTRAKQKINAQNLYTCPGFIDILNHSDSFFTLFTIPSQDSLITQGITTILGGNCGSSLAPLTQSSAINSIQKWTDLNQVNLNWLNTQDFLNALESKKLSINFASLVGHGTIRRGILHDENRILNNSEIKILKNVLETSLEQGSYGMSSGLAYSHEKSTSLHEIIELAKIIKKYNGIYATHIRGEGEELLPSLEEAIKIGIETRVKIQISHLKAMGKTNWSKMNQAIELIEQARERGVDINFDIYPYSVTGSVLYVLLPDWVAQGGKKLLLARLRDPILAQKVTQEMQADPYDYKKIIIAQGNVNKSFIGKKLSEIAKHEGISEEQAVINMLLASEGRISVFFNALSSENVEKAIAHELGFVCTNGAGYSNDYEQEEGLVHPRCFGAMPRFLKHYVQEKKLLSWEQAIRKITFLPAQKIGLKKRGQIKKGFFADIAIINPKTITDKATFSNPYQYSQGVEYVVVNGQVVLENGKQKNILPGIVLRKN